MGKTLGNPSWARTRRLRAARSPAVVTPFACGSLRAPRSRRLQLAPRLRLEHEGGDAARLAANGEDARVRAPPRAHLGDVEARLGEPRARRVGVAHAPRDAPGAVRRARVPRRRACLGQA